MAKDQADGRVVRRTLPTMSFTAPKPLQDWVREEARRRNITASKLITLMIERERSEPSEAVAA